MLYNGYFAQRGYDDYCGLYYTVVDGSLFGEAEMSHGNFIWYLQLLYAYEVHKMNENELHEFLFNKGVKKISEDYKNKYPKLFTGYYAVKASEEDGLQGWITGFDSKYTAGLQGTFCESYDDIGFDYFYVSDSDDDESDLRVLLRHCLFNPINENTFESIKEIDIEEGKLFLYDDYVVYSKEKNNIDLDMVKEMFVKIIAMNLELVQEAVGI